MKLRPISLAFRFVLSLMLVFPSALVCFAQGTQTAAPPADFHRTIETCDGWFVRYGILPSGTALRSLIGKAESLDISSVREADSAAGDRRVLGTGQAQGLFPVPLEAAASAVIDVPNLPKVSSSILNATLIESSGLRFRAREKIGFEFLGLSIGYEVIVDTLVDRLPGGAVGVRSRLVESLDGKIYRADVSWYFAPVVIDGKEYTYMRLWSVSGLANPAPGVPAALELFSKGELKGQVRAVAALAEKNPGRRLP